MLKVSSRLKPFGAYLGKIVLYDSRLYFVREVRILHKAVHFVIRNEEGDEKTISTTALLDGLLEEVEPRVYQFMNPEGWGMADERESHPVESKQA